MLPTASPFTAIANVVSGSRRRMARMNSRASCRVYGLGNASRRFFQMLRLFAYFVSDSTSEVCHDRTSHVASLSSMVCWSSQRFSTGRGVPPPRRAFADASLRLHRPSLGMAAGALDHIAFTGNGSFSETLEREGRQIEPGVAAGDDIREDAAGGGRMLKAVAAETVDEEQ